MDPRKMVLMNLFLWQEYKYRYREQNNGHRGGRRCREEDRGRIEE